MVFNILATCLGTHQYFLEIEGKLSYSSTTPIGDKMLNTHPITIRHVYYLNKVMT